MLIIKLFFARFYTENINKFKGAIYSASDYPLIFIN